MRGRFFLGLLLVAVGLGVLWFALLSVGCMCAAVPPERRPAIRMSDVVTYAALGTVLVGALLSLWSFVQAAARRGRR